MIAFITVQKINSETSNKIMSARTAMFNVKNASKIHFSHIFNFNLNLTFLY